jgi:thioesterase domain-containing protein
LLAVHCWGDESSHYQRLAAALNDHQVISLLVPADPTKLPVTVDQWVDVHESTIEALLAASPPVGPPYRIIGYSFGGVIALELARRLRQRGYAVQYVGLIDTIKPRQIMPTSLREYLWFHLRWATEMDDRSAGVQYMRRRVVFYLYRRFNRVAEMARRVLRLVGVRTDLPPRIAPPVHTDPAMASIYLSFQTYRSRRVDFPVTVLTTAGSVNYTGSASLGWASWLDAGFNVVSIPGEHLAVFDDQHIGGVADGLRHTMTLADPK